MRKRKMYVKVMAVMLAAVMLLTTVNLNAFLSAAGNATKDALTESGWDYAFEADLFGSSVSYLDEAFDVYQYQWTTDPSATGSKVGPVKPTATDPNSYNGSYSYFTTQYYGNASRGGLKPTSIQGGNNNGLTMLTYNKGIMKDFEAEYEFYAEAAMMGLTFGGEAGKFQITQDGNNSNDTAVALYMEGNGKLLVSGAIDTNNVTASGDARVETDVNASWYGWINNTANVVASGMTGKDTISVENDLTKNSKTFTVCIKVQDGVLSIYEKNHSDNVLNVKLSEQYQSGPVSLVHTNTNQGAFKSFGIRNNGKAEEKQWDDSFQAELFGASVSYLNDAFDVYQYQWTTDPAATGSKVGPVKPTATDPNSYQGNYSYFTTQYYGNASRGGLKPTSIQGGDNNGFTTLTYNKGIMENFEAEYEFYSEAVMGLTFGGEAGKFQITQDMNHSNDTAVALYMEGNGNLFIYGAIKPTSASATSDVGIYTNVTENWYGWVKGAANIRATGMTGDDKIEVENDLTENSKTFTVCVKVQNGVLTVYEKNHADRIVSVNLSEKYQSGPVSLFHTNTNQGAFKSFGIRKIENEDPNPPVPDMEQAKVGDGFASDFTTLSTAELNASYNSFYFANAFAKAVEGSATERWTTGTDLADYEGYFQNRWLKPMHKNGGQYSLLSYKQLSFKNVDVTAEYVTNHLQYGIMIAPKGELAAAQKGVKVWVEGNGTIMIAGAVDGATGTAVGGQVRYLVRIHWEDFLSMVM